MRFSELRILKGVSSRTLSDRLRELEEIGLVRREVFSEKPVRVEYMLTPDGRRVGEQAYDSLGRLVDVWKREVRG